MTTLFHRLTAAAVFGLISTAALAEISGPVLLTVSGALEAPTRGAFDESKDKYFDYNGVVFDAAAQYDFAKLEALPQVAVQADFPMGGPVHSFEGPLLADVLNTAGATGKTVTIRALDGYAMEAPLAELIDKGAIMALSRNGEPFAIGDFGPIQIAFPRAERAELSEMNDDLWVWSVFHVEVH